MGRTGGRTLRKRCPIKMSISMTRSDDAVVVVLEDDGPPFNVAAALPKPADRPLAAARPGGPGIQLIRTFSSELTYDHNGGMNCTTLKFPWPQPVLSLV